MEEEKDESEGFEERVDRVATEIVGDVDEFKEDWEDNSAVACYSRLKELAKVIVRQSLLLNPRRINGRLAELEDIVRSEHPGQVVLRYIQTPPPQKEEE